MKNNHSWQLSSREGYYPNKPKGDTLPPFSPWDWEGFEPLPLVERLRTTESVVTRTENSWPSQVSSFLATDAILLSRLIGLAHRWYRLFLVSCLPGQVAANSFYRELLLIDAQWKKDKDPSPYYLSLDKTNASLRSSFAADSMGRGIHFIWRWALAYRLRLPGAHAHSNSFIIEPGSEIDSPKAYLGKTSSFSHSLRGEKDLSRLKWK